VGAEQGRSDGDTDEAEDISGNDAGPDGQAALQQDLMAGGGIEVIEPRRRGRLAECQTRGSVLRAQSDLRPP
jgi:hypothetical protein